MCSSVFLSFHPEHVSVSGCLSPGFACWKQSGPRWQQSILHVAVAASEPLGKWPFGQGSSLPRWAGSFLSSMGLVGVLLDSGLSVITSYIEAVAQVGVATWFFWARTYA